MTERRDTDRVLIMDGHTRPEPDVTWGEDQRTGKSVVVNETHFSPAPIYLAVDQTTGLVYGGPSPEHALYGMDYEPDDDNPQVNPPVTISRDEYDALVARVNSTIRDETPVPEVHPDDPKD